MDESVVMELFFARPNRKPPQPAPMGVVALIWAWLTAMVFLSLGLISPHWV